jgi:hypothetical protein
VQLRQPRIALTALSRAGGGTYRFRSGAQALIVDLSEMVAQLTVHGPQLRP